MSAQIIFWKEKLALLKYMEEFEGRCVFYFINWTSLTDSLHYEQTVLAIISPTIIVIAVVQPLVMSDSLHPHALQHVMLPCPSLCPRFCSNSCLLSQWCPPTIFFLFFSSPLSSSSPALNLSQHQGSFQWVSSSPKRPKYWQNFRYIATNQTKVVNICKTHLDLINSQLSEYHQKGKK